MNLRKIRLHLAALSVCAGMSFGAAIADTVQQVEIRTSLGTIVVELDANAAPQTCAAFLFYIQKHVYEDSSFYQLNEEAIQGGKPGRSAVGFSKNGNFVPSPPPGEFSLKHIRGAIGLSRTVGDCNPTKLSNSTQFYVLRRDAPQDDGQFSLFGHVVQGMDIVDRIADSLAKDSRKPVTFDVVVADTSP